jgi:hypothetical protein
MITKKPVLSGLPKNRQSQFFSFLRLKHVVTARDKSIGPGRCTLEQKQYNEKKPVEDRQPRKPCEKGFSGNFETADSKLSCLWQETTLKY